MGHEEVDELVEFFYAPQHIFSRTNRDFSDKN